MIRHPIKPIDQQEEAASATTRRTLCFRTVWGSWVLFEDLQGNAFLAQWDKAFQLNSGVALIDLLTAAEVKRPFVALALDEETLLT